VRFRRGGYRMLAPRPPGAGPGVRGQSAPRHRTRLSDTPAARSVCFDCAGNEPQHVPSKVGLHTVRCGRASAEPSFKSRRHCGDDHAALAAASAAYRRLPDAPSAVRPRVRGRAISIHRASSDLRRPPPDRGREPGGQNPSWTRHHGPAAGTGVPGGLGVPVVLDGELIDGAGRPAEFYGLAGAIAFRRRTRPLTLVAFDLPHWKAGRSSTAPMTSGEP
jgi:hypothetical protein